MESCFVHAVRCCRVGINSGPEDQKTLDQGTQGPMGVQLFLEFYMLHKVPLLVVFHSQSRHDASHDVYQLEIISAPGR